MPDWVDWDRWVGPAPRSPFHEQKLSRDNHENMTAFSLGMISCWGIHHLDIAQWGNDTDDTGPTRVEGRGEFPKAGAFDTLERWQVRFKYARATPVIFVSDGTPGFEHGVRFVGETAWAHVRRGAIDAAETPAPGQALVARRAAFLNDPQNQPEALPVQLPVSSDHVRNFLDAIKRGTRALCDIGPAVRGDTLCQLALIAVKQGRKLQWNPAVERFVNDDGVSLILRPVQKTGVPLSATAMPLTGSSPVFSTTGSRKSTTGLNAAFFMGSRISRIGSLGSAVAEDAPRSNGPRK